MSYENKHTRGKGVPFHQTLKFTADLKFDQKEKCEECHIVFSKNNPMFAYGSLRVQICRKCFFEKLK